MKVEPYTTPFQITIYLKGRRMVFNLRKRDQTLTYSFRIPKNKTEQLRRQIILSRLIKAMNYDS